MSNDLSPVKTIKLSPTRLEGMEINSFAGQVHSRNTSPTRLEGMEMMAPLAIMAFFMAVSDPP